MGHTLSFTCLLCCLMVSFGGAQDVPTTTCYNGYFGEGETLNCTCLGGCSNGERPTLTWPGHSDTERLEKTNVTREQDGHNFTCRRVCGSEKAEVNYTLRVTYGPDTSTTKIIGPSFFVTNGTLPMILTCKATANPSPSYTWNGVTCDNGNSYNTCTYTPSIPGDGKRVTCLVVNSELRPAKSVSMGFHSNISYPPQTAPNISEGLGPVLKAEDILTCTVTGGKPLVDSVNFSCTSPYDVLQVHTTNTSVSSSLTIDTSQATTDNMTCYCSASWAPRPEFYTVNSERTFLTQYPAKAKNFVLNNTNKTVTVTESDHRNVTIQCEASGRPGPGLLLKKTSHDGTVTLNEKHEGSNDVTYTYLDHNITMADWTDMGNYTCVVWNHVGDNDSIQITLNVNSQPRPTSEGSEGRDPNRPLNMTAEGIKIVLSVYPEPDNFTYTHYTNDSDHTGGRVPQGMFTSHVMDSGPGSNFMTCFISGVNVPEKYIGVYKVNISNVFGSIDYFFIVQKPLYQTTDEDEGGVDKGLIIGIVVAVVFVIIIVLAVVIFLWRKSKETKENHRLTSSDSEHSNPAYLRSGLDADNDSDIGMNGRTPAPEMHGTNVDSKPVLQQSDGAGYASLNEIANAKQQEGVLRGKRPRTAAYEDTSITPTGQVSIKQAASQPNVCQDPWDTKDKHLAGAPGGPPTPHNFGPKGDEYAMVSKNKTTITVGPNGNEYSRAAKHGKGDNTQGSPAKAPVPGQLSSASEGKGARNAKGSSALDADGYATANGIPEAKSTSSPSGPAAPLSMTPHPLDTPGYATLAQMAPDKGCGSLSSTSGSLVKNTSSTAEGTDT